MTRRTRRGILILTLLAIVTGLVGRQPAELILQPPTELDTRLNYAMHDFRGRLLDQEGGINLEIESPTLRNNAQTGIGTVVEPELRIREEPEQWNITSESAIITADREYVSLMGDVFITRENEITGERLEITTRDVLLNVTPRLAKTEERVSIRQGNDRLDAIGMDLDMINNEFVLHEDVKALYDTP